MNNINLYLKIIDANNLINTIVIISEICIIINFIISIILHIRNNKNNSKNINNDSKIIDTKNNNAIIIIEIIGSIFIFSIILNLILMFGNINKYISFIYIPSIILVFYMIYIKPLITDKPSVFKFDYYEYGTLIALSLLIFSKIDYKNLFVNVKSEGTMQVICILILLFEVYSCFYCLLLNIYFVIKNLKKINISKVIKVYKNAVEKIYFKFDFNDIKLEFINTEKLLYNTNISNFRKYLLFLTKFILDIILCSFKYVFSLFLSFLIKPFLTILNFILSKIIQLSNTNENQINYGLSKIIWTFSIIFTYIILQINNIFQSRIINTYEFISSVIIIPIILESLISFKNKLKIK